MHLGDHAWVLGATTAMLTWPLRPYLVVIIGYKYRTRTPEKLLRHSSNTRVKILSPDDSVQQSSSWQDTANKTISYLFTTSLQYNLSTTVAKIYWDGKFKVNCVRYIFFSFLMQFSSTGNLEMKKWTSSILYLDWCMETWKFLQW